MRGCWVVKAVVPFAVNEEEPRQARSRAGGMAEPERQQLLLSPRGLAAEPRGALAAQPERYKLQRPRGNSCGARGAIAAEPEMR